MPALVSAAPRDAPWRQRGAQALPDGPLPAAEPGHAEWLCHHAPHRHIRGAHRAGLRPLDVNCPTAVIPASLSGASSALHSHKSGYVLTAHRNVLMVQVNFSEDTSEEVFI